VREAAALAALAALASLSALAALAAGSGAECTHAPARAPLVRRLCAAYV
jgi:hypothetical protein